MQESSAYCPTCDKQVLVRRESTPHILHLLLSLVTVGFWLPLWFLSAVAHSIGGWRCSACGKAVGATNKFIKYAGYGVGGFLLVSFLLGLLFMFLGRFQ